MSDFPLSYGTLRGGGVSAGNAGVPPGMGGDSAMYYPLRNNAFGDPAARPQRQGLLDYEGFGTVKQQTALKMPAPSVVPVSQLDGFVQRVLPGPRAVKGIPGLKQPGHV